MKITLLGTGTSQGVPIIGCTCGVCMSIDFRDKRLRTSALLEIHGKTFLIDGGPDLRQQAMRHRIPKIDAVILTHEHRDHTAGLDELRSYNFMQKTSIPVYAWPRVLAQIEKDYAYVFAPNPYPGIPRLDLIPITEIKQRILGIDFTFPTVMHATLPVMGVMTNGFAYLTDVKTISAEVMPLLKSLRLLVLNALQQDSHISHLTLQEALNLTQTIAPSQTYLTHISHRLGRHVDVNATLPPMVNLGYDGVVLMVI